MAKDCLEGKGRGPVAVERAPGGSEELRTVAEELKQLKEELKQLKQPPPPCLGIAPDVQCPGSAPHIAAEMRQSWPEHGDARPGISPSSSPELPRTQPEGWILPRPLEHRRRGGSRAPRRVGVHKGKGPETAWLEQPGGLREAAPLSPPTTHPRHGSPRGTSSGSRGVRGLALGPRYLGDPLARSWTHPLGVYCTVCSH